MTSKFVTAGACLSGILMLSGCGTYYSDHPDRGAYRYYNYDGPIPRHQDARIYGPPPYGPPPYGPPPGPPPGAYADGRMMERDLRRRFPDGRFRVRREGSRLALEMPADILFDLDSAEIRPEAKEAIRSVAETLKRFRGTDVDVYGYTDTSGTKEHNRALSETRANAVAGELARDGVAPQSIRAEGFGETALAVPTKNGVREARNRRVEIVFLPPQERRPPPGR